MTVLPIQRSFIDASGVEITFYEWPVAEPKAAIQLAHGLGEHARRYDHVAAALNRAGYTVYADDHRGHGQTGKQQLATGSIKTMGNLGPGGMKATFAEVKQLTDLIRSEHAELPIVLLGHSWGSMIAQRVINKHYEAYAGLILSGSAVLIPGLLASGGDNRAWDKLPDASGKEWLSRDHTVGVRFNADPFNFPESAMQVFGIGNSLALMGIPSRKLPNELPVLLQVGAEDSIGGEKANSRLFKLFQRAGIDDLELLAYHGARHEVYNETNKEEVLEDLTTWLARRFS